MVDPTLALFFFIVAVALWVLAKDSGKDAIIAMLTEDLKLSRATAIEQLERADRAVDVISVKAGGPVVSKLFDPTHSTDPIDGDLGEFNLTEIYGDEDPDEAVRESAAKED